MTVRGGAQSGAAWTQRLTQLGRAASPAASELTNQQQHLPIIRPAGCVALLGAQCSDSQDRVQWPPGQHDQILSGRVNTWRMVIFFKSVNFYNTHFLKFGNYQKVGKM